MPACSAMEVKPSLPVCANSLRSRMPLPKPTPSSKSWSPSLSKSSHVAEAISPWVSGCLRLGSSCGRGNFSNWKLPLLMYNWARSASALSGWVRKISGKPSWFTSATAPASPTESSHLATWRICGSVRSKMSPCAPVKPLWLAGICTSLKPMSWLFANGWLALYAPMPAAPMMAMAKAA